MACCDLLLVRCWRLQRSAKCKYTHYRPTYCLVVVIRGADVTVWDFDPWKSRVWAFARKREITGEPLNSRSRILAPKWREITGVDCIIIKLDVWNICHCLRVRSWCYALYVFLYSYVHFVSVAASVAIVKSRDMHWGLLAQRDHKDINLTTLRMLMVADGANPCEYTGESTVTLYDMNGFE